MTKTERVAEAHAAITAAERKVEKMAAHLAGAELSLVEALGALCAAEALPDDPEPEPVDPAYFLAGGSAAAHNPTVMIRDYT